MRDLTSRFASLSGQRESQKKGQRLKAEEDRFWAAKKFDRELALTRTEIKKLKDLITQFEGYVSRYKHQVFSVSLLRTTIRPVPAGGEITSDLSSPSEMQQLVNQQLKVCLNSCQQLKSLLFEVGVSLSSKGDHSPHQQQHTFVAYREVEEVSNRIVDGELSKEKDCEKLVTVDQLPLIKFEGIGKAIDHDLISFRKGILKALYERLECHSQHYKAILSLSSHFRITRNQICKRFSESKSLEWKNKSASSSNAIFRMNIKSMVIDNGKQQAGIPINELSSMKDTGGFIPQPLSASAPERLDVGDMYDDREVQELQMENQMLLSTFEASIDEIRVVERQVMEIGSLQDQFSDQVMKQAEDIDFLQQMVEETKGSLDHGIENLEAAIQDGSLFRRFVIVLIICLSLGLLFVSYFHS